MLRSESASSGYTKWQLARTPYAYAFAGCSRRVPAGKGQDRGHRRRGARRPRPAQPSPGVTAAHAAPTPPTRRRSVSETGNWQQPEHPERRPEAPVGLSALSLIFYPERRVVLTCCNCSLRLDAPTLLTCCSVQSSSQDESTKPGGSISLLFLFLLLVEAKSSLGQVTYPSFFPPYLTTLTPPPPHPSR